MHYVNKRRRNGQKARLSLLFYIYSVNTGLYNAIFCRTNLIIASHLIFKQLYDQNWRINFAMLFLSLLYYYFLKSNDSRITIGLYYYYYYYYYYFIYFCLSWNYVMDILPIIWSPLLYEYPCHWHLIIATIEGRWMNIYNIIHILRSMRENLQIFLS